MGLSLFLLYSVIAKQVWCLWLALFYDYRAVLNILNIQKIKQKLKTNVCCLTKSVICHLCDKNRMRSLTTERRKETVLSQLAACFFEQVLLRPCVLHTALQSPTANIPQTKINVVSLGVKSLNKQKYQQSASSLCPRVGHNRLFVELKL